MDYKASEDFIYRNARLLDFLRYRFLFQHGSAEDVLAVLSRYQNSDGGFGHALECDCFNPDSSPMATWKATTIIRETGVTKHEVIDGLLSYLDSGASFDGCLWDLTVPSNNDWPHAPWWNHVEGVRSWNPTAALAGFIITYADRGSSVYRKAETIIGKAIEYFFSSAPLESMHTACCFVSLYEDLVRVGYDFDRKKFRPLLSEQIRHLVSHDPSVWETEYSAKPSLFISSRKSEFLAGNEEIIRSECAFIRRTQCHDGSWAVNWNWETYPETWPLAEHFWKSQIIIRNLAFLKEFS